MPVLHGDDISNINDFSLNHGKEWLIIDKWGEGIRLAFKDNTAYLYVSKSGTFGTLGGWDFEAERTKQNLGLQEEEVVEEKEEEEVVEVKEEEEEEEESDE
tara:strand:- start:422 stop:724 length:303 start_codon:yes stop_codon:yes gene_type:complete